MNPREAVMQYDADIRAKLSKSLPWKSLTWEQRLDLLRDHE